MRWTFLLKVAVLITDGPQSTAEPHVPPEVASSALQKRGVIVYTIGLGNQVSASQLEGSASASNYAYSAESFVELRTALYGIASLLCEGKCTSSKKESVRVRFVIVLLNL